MSKIVASVIGLVFSMVFAQTGSGGLLWDNSWDREAQGHDSANAVAVSGNTVFAAGLTQTAADGYAFTVRAYSAKNGSLMWENNADQGGTGYGAAYALAVSGNRVFAAGTTSTAAGGNAFTVRAYSAHDGSILWESDYDGEGIPGWDWANGLAVSGNRVFAAGLTSTAAGGNAFTVRAYSAREGSLLWQDRYEREGTGSNWANGLAVSGDRVFAAGMTSTAAGGSAFTVRAYSARDGSLLWQDRYDREGTGSDVADALAVRGDRVFVVGQTQTAAGGDSFTVRAYSKRPLGPLPVD